MNISTVKTEQYSEAELKELIKEKFQNDVTTQGEPDVRLFRDEDGSIIATVRTEY